jgi:hypothetical protein
MKPALVKYESLCETFLAVFITGCFWGNPAQANLWVDSLERVAGSAKMAAGRVYLLNLRRYPSLLLLYAGGIAALAGRNYENFASILARAKANNEQGEKEPMCSVIFPLHVMENDIMRLLPGMERHHTPLSDYLFAKLRTPLREFLPSDVEYQTAFDRFEYLFGLVYADMNRKQVRDGAWWGPVGCFAWRRHVFGGERAIEAIKEEIETEGANWGPLKAGLFGGSLEQVKAAKEKFDAFTNLLGFY